MRRLLAITLVPLAIAAAGCGGHAKKKAAPATSVASLQAPIIPQTQRAPDIATLHDQFGRPFRLSSLRGNAVAVTFVYAHCPDVCPLIMQALGGAKHALGADGGHFRIVAVSVDPKGDTPRYVRHFLAVRGLLHSVTYLLGTRRQLQPVWTSWHVQADPADPSGELGHSAFVYGVDARGVIRALYPASPLDPKVIAHDARILWSV